MDGSNQLTKHPGFLKKVIIKRKNHIYVLISPSKHTREAFSWPLKLKVAKLNSKCHILLFFKIWKNPGEILNLTLNFQNYVKFPKNISKLNYIQVEE